MDISLTDDLQSFVDERVANGEYESSSDYVSGLIRHEKDKERLRQLLLEGAASPPGSVVDDAYFEKLRRRISERAAKRA